MSGGVQLTNLFSQLVLLIQLLQFLSKLCVLLSQAGVPLVVLLHLILDVVQRHLEMRCHLLPFLLLQAGPLHPFILQRKKRRVFHSFVA